MPTYVFKGRNRLNEMVSGEKDAASQDELRALLRREQIVMTQASEKGREFSIPKLGRKKKVGAKELAVFTRQFSVMIDAGLPLVSCIEILAEQQSNVFFQRRFASGSPKCRRRRNTCRFASKTSESFRSALHTYGRSR